MGQFGYYIVSAVLLSAFVAISWITVGLLHLSGMLEMIVRACLIAAGFGAYGLVIAWKQRRGSRGAASGGGAATPAKGGPPAEIDSLIHDAGARLAASPVGRNASLATLPLVYLVGETGSAKTSILVHSGLEPDLLAGQVYQDNAIVPTGTANFWLAHNAVFAEAGGALLADAAEWTRLLGQLRPDRWRTLFSKTANSPRAAVAFVPADPFFRVGGEDSLIATARNLRTRLGEIAQALGTSIPVYVVFTKLDRMSFFNEFAATLTDEEARQVLGVTLPLRAASSGVYAEEEAGRLTLAFDTMVDSLAAHRLVSLPREHNAANLPAIYEFPRELRKIRKGLVRFLVELGRPSQLRANPFLRGFYFCGVRPVEVKEAVAAAHAPQAQQAAQATRFFPDSPDEPLAAPAQQFRTRRVPQWLFLDHLFTKVVLRDQTASAAAGVGRPTMLARRALLAAAMGLLLVWSIGMTVSYFGNRGLIERSALAARAIGGSETGDARQAIPRRDVLERLDSLRQSVELLSRYEREGPPWRLRWGLYSGHEIYPGVRRLYFSRFHQILFGATQAGLAEALQKLPSRPEPADEYKPVYDALKAYLITTSHHEKSTRSFLAPLLMEKWAAGRQIDPERAALARTQFEFYSEELKLANPFSSESNGEAVARGRFYLAQFNASERIYQFVLSEAARQNPPVNFNRRFPGSAAFVLNSLDVPGAFSLEGWKFMEDAIRNVKRFFGGESWVLGETAFADLDPAKLSAELLDRYHRDFLGNWRAYLAKSEILPYRGAADAAQKLKQLASNQSYLLALFCLASVNTSVPFDDAKNVYQPVQYVTPQGCLDRYVQDANSAYMGGLGSLQSAMERVAASSGAPKEELVAQTASEAANALKTTRDIAQKFRIDREGNVHAMVQKLMEDPIHRAEAVLGQLGPAQMNAEGKRFCAQFSTLAAKYPFNTSSKVDATLDEINGVFRPGDGKLSTLYESDIKNHVERQGTQYVRKAGARVHITDGFLRFFNRAMAFSEALYQEGKGPSLTYSMKVLPAEGLQGINLTLDGQVLKGSAKGGEARQFTWPGGEHAARLAGNMGGAELNFITYDGLWATFRFFGDADRFQSAGGTYTLQWAPRQGQSSQSIRLSNGKELTLPFQLDLRGAPPVFQKGYLSGFECVSDIAR